jgi:hypothetical protein
VPTTTLSLVIGIDGVGSAGDSQNRSGSGPTPNHPQRSLTVEILDTSGNAALGSDGAALPAINATAAYQAGGAYAGLFVAQFSLPRKIVTGQYRVRIFTTGHLRRMLPAHTITVGQANAFTDVAYLIAGDVNNSNTLTSDDYDAIAAAYGATYDAGAAYNPLDVDDDGTVTGADLNLYMREKVNYSSGD